MEWWDSFVDGAGDIFEDISSGAKNLINSVGDVTGALNNVIGSAQPSQTVVKVPVQEVVQPQLKASFFDQNKGLILVGAGLAGLALVATVIKK